MTDEPDTPQPDTLKCLWQDQPTELTTMSLQAIHTRANKFQSIVFWRNTREYIASVFVAGIFGYFAATSDSPMMQLSCALIIAGVAFVSLFIWLNGRADRAGARASDDCLNFHRQALVRQSRMLRNVWLWYLLPMVPGMALFLWTTAQAVPTHQWWRNLVSFGFVAVVFVGVGLLNRWGARCLDRELAKLED